MKQFFIYLGILLCFSGFLEKPYNYDYNASNIIINLREYEKDTEMDNLVIHRDSSFSQRNTCYKLMNDKRIHIIHGNTSRILSEEEAVKLVREIASEYEKEKAKNPLIKKKPKSNSKYHGYRTVYRA